MTDCTAVAAATADDDDDADVHNVPNAENGEQMKQNPDVRIIAARSYYTSS